MKKILTLVLVLFSFNSFALMELSVNYWGSSQKFGTNNVNVSESETYSATLAWYIFAVTALEFSYTRTEDITEENTPATSGALTINSSRNSVKTDSVGIGLRQALASRKSRIIPAISIGYSEQRQRGETFYDVTNSGANTTFTLNDGIAEEELTYVTFSLRIKITKTLGLNGSVTGFYDDFDFSETAESTRYTAGLSWYF